MKKLFLAVMAIATIAMVGCKKGGNEPVGPVGPGGGGGGGEEPAATEEAPEVAAPAAGKVTFVIQIPQGSECNGIAFKGTLDGTNWSGENTYVGEGKQDASAADCIKFEKVEGKKTWFQATYTVGATPWGDAGTIRLAGKICLIYKNDKDWQGQAEDWEVIADYTTVANSQSNDGNIQVDGDKGLLYVKIGGWQNSECQSKVEHDYTITVKAPSCAASVPEIVGEFDEWKGTALTKSGDAWTAKIHAWEGCKIKVRESSEGKADDAKWANQIQEYNAEEDKWNDCPDQKLGADVNFTFDFSDAAKYRWTVCGE